MKIHPTTVQYQSLQGPELVQTVKAADKNILKEVIIPALSWNQIYFLSLTLDEKQRSYLKYSPFSNRLEN